MLWYKNWLEIRWGALYILLYWIGVTILFLTLDLVGVDFSIPHHAPFYRFLLLIACLGFVILAGSGVDTYMLDLKTLPNARTTLFTLSLPVTRRRLMLTRSAIGLIAMIVVNVPFELIMWYLTSGKTPVIDLSVPFLEVTIFGVCMYCLVIFLSTLVRGGLLFPLACLIVFVCFGIATGDWAPSALHIIEIDMSPMDVIAPLPWLPVLTYITLGALFLFTALKVVESRDY